MNETKSVMLDSSFIIRLLNPKDAYHQQAKTYFHYFTDYQVAMYLSTITVSEYAVVGNPQILRELNIFRIVDFNYLDALKSGAYAAFLKKRRKNAKNTRTIVLNDLKILAQIDNKKIDAIISNDRILKTKVIDPLCQNQLLKCTFIDFTKPLNEFLGTLF